MRCLPPAFAVLVMALLMSSEVDGQEPSAPPPEMKALERLLGTWKVEQIVKVPEESRSTNTVKRELVLGGRFVQEVGGGVDNLPRHTGMYTYDSDRKAYRYWFFMSGGFYWEPTGTWDESSQTLTFTGKVGARRSSGITTVTFRFSDETTLIFSLITRDAGGEIIYRVEGKSVRQDVNGRQK